MKKVIISCMAFFLSAASVSAGGNLDLKKVTDGTFSAEYISGIKPIEGTDLYARISDDGQRIVRYSFKTGKQVDVLFDVNDTQGQKVKSFDSYILSPDGTRILICTNSQKIYRRTFKATYYIYTADRSKIQHGRPTAGKWLSYATITSFW